MWTYRLALFAKELMPWTLGPGLALAKLSIRPKPTDWPIRWFIATLQGKDRQALAHPERYRIIIESGRESLSSGTAAIRTDGDIYTSDWGFDPKDIRIPLRIWHGELDKNIPVASVKKIATMIPKALPRWFPEDGHYSLPLLHSAEMVEEMMRD
jgi:pimeloyl-ACP methyl ester carboxylesterase